MEKKSFIVRIENGEQVRMLTDEQAGKLFKSLFSYMDSGETIQTADRLLLFAFSVFKGQLDRDAEKYKETCRKRSESGKKGGAPKGNTNAAKNKQNKQKQTKTSKTSLPDPECECVCECDPEPEPDPVPVCERECDPESEAQCADTPHTAHTPRNGDMISLQDVLSLASRFGYRWDEAEAREFLAYNIDKGRKGGWSFASLHRSF